MIEILKIVIRYTSENLFNQFYKDSMYPQCRISFVDLDLIRFGMPLIAVEI